MFLIQSKHNLKNNFSEGRKLKSTHHICIQELYAILQELYSCKSRQCGMYSVRQNTNGYTSFQVRVGW